MEEKRRIVEKTYVKGWSVARVAREHGVNANQVFGWRKLYEKGRLGGPAMKLLPASVADTRRTRRLRHRSVKEKQQIVNASLEPGARVKDIARAHGVAASLVYDWRKQFAGKSRPQKVRAVDLLPVAITEVSGPRSQDVVPPTRAIEIELPKGRLRIIGADAGLLRAAMELLR